MKLRKSVDTKNNYKTVLMYGEPKTGKTYWSDTMPSPVLRLNMVTEFDGEASLPDNSASMSIDIDNYTDLYITTVALGMYTNTYKKPTESDNKLALVKVSKDVCMELSEALTALQPKSIVIDSFVAMQDYMRQHILDNDVKSRENGWDLYGHVIDMTMFHMARWMRMPLHKCFITLVDSKRDDNTGKTLHIPKFLGNASYAKIPPMCSIIGRLHVGEPWAEDDDRNRWLQVGTADNYVAGIRDNKMDRPLDLPADLTQVFETIYNIKGESK